MSRFLLQALGFNPAGDLWDTGWSPSWRGKKAVYLSTKSHVIPLEGYFQSVNSLTLLACPANGQKKLWWPEIISDKKL